MNRKVKRYDPINSDGTCGMCIEDADYGAYVEYADYAALEAENAKLRAQQPQSAQAVAFQKPSVLKDCNVRYSTSTTPQPSAGVVMPGRAEVSVRYGYRSMGYAEGWNACLDEFARLNGKEVGRG